MANSNCSLPDVNLDKSTCDLTPEEVIALAELRLKVTSSKDLSKYQLEDSFLLKFLRARLLDIPKSLLHISAYFQLRRKSPQIFQLPSKSLSAFSTKVFTILPNRGPSGEILVILRVANWDPSKHHFDTVIGGPLPFLEYINEVEGSKVQRAGVTQIVDVRGMSFGQLMHISLRQHALLSAAIEQGTALRYNYVHLVYTNRYLTMAWNILKYFCSVEFRAKVISHGDDLQAIYEKVPKEYLPCHLGGHLSDDGNSWSKEELLEMDSVVERYWQKYEPIV